MQLTPIMYGLFAAMTITLTACDKPQTPVENTSLSTPKAEQIVALAGKTMGSTYHIKYLKIIFRLRRNKSMKILKKFLWMLMLKCLLISRPLS